jgi:hypothetical protein
VIAIDLAGINSQMVRVTSILQWIMVLQVDWDDNHLYSAYADARMNSNNAAVNGYDPCAIEESQEQDKQIPFQSWRKGKADRYYNQNPREKAIKMNNNVAADRRQRDISGAIHTRLKSRDATRFGYGYFGS